jgi:hypothetical protein
MESHGDRGLVSTEEPVTGTCTRCEHSWWSHNQHEHRRFCCARPGPSERMCFCDAYTEQEFDDRERGLFYLEQKLDCVLTFPGRALVVRHVKHPYIEVALRNLSWPAFASDLGTEKANKAYSRVGFYVFPLGYSELAGRNERHLYLLCHGEAERHAVLDMLAAWNSDGR